jgi:hypothetical protein
MSYKALMKMYGESGSQILEFEDLDDLYEQVKQLKPHHTMIAEDGMTVLPLMSFGHHSGQIHLLNTRIRFAGKGKPYLIPRFST